MLHGIEHIEERFFVFLHIFVIREAEPFLHAQQRHQIAEHAAALAADELAYIRVLLLRHDAGAGGERIIQLRKAEFPCAPQDDLLADAGQMHHQDGTVRRRFHAIIPIRYPIHGIVGDLRKTQLLTDKLTVDRIGRGSQRP